MMNTLIAVVSYKRPNNNTCNLLKETTLNWKVYVYSFEEYLDEYIKNYGAHVEIIPYEKIAKANLPTKRQYVLDDAYQKNYFYCIMLDDDIESITYNDINASIIFMCNKLIQQMHKSPKYVAISTAYNKSETSKQSETYKNICNNTIFDLTVFHKSNVRYNPESKCEDMELAIELYTKGYVACRNNQLIVKNTLQGGTTNDGLSYRFKDSNRFIIEGEYMCSKYPKLKDAFEYDEKHFKLNSQKLKKLLKTVYFINC